MSISKLNSREYDNGSFFGGSYSISSYDENRNEDVLYHVIKGQLNVFDEELGDTIQSSTSIKAFCVNTFKASYQGYRGDSFFWNVLDQDRELVTFAPLFNDSDPTCLSKSIRWGRGKSHNIDLQINFYERVFIVAFLATEDPKEQNQGGASYLLKHFINTFTSYRDLVVLEPTHINGLAETMSKKALASWYERMGFTRLYLKGKPWIMALATG